MKDTQRTEHSIASDYHTDRAFGGVVRVVDRLAGAVERLAMAHCDHPLYGSPYEPGSFSTSNWLEGYEACQACGMKRPLAEES